jgi:ATP-dependent Lhr-like helicase
LLQAVALCELVESGWVEPLLAPPRPAHLVGQQLLAGVLNEGRVERGAWRRTLARVFDAAGLGAAEGEAIHCS